jgi:magnesium chelatase family protein
MAAQRFRALLPDLDEGEAVEVSSLYSLAGLLGPDAELERRPPFRAPHHSASLEGLIGGGRHLRPGEISLAHRGVLFLDEAPEFRVDVLQSLREPLEEGRVSLVRAGSLARFPADFQLLLAANPCPCGNLGRQGKACLCSIGELQRYRRKLGGPLLDRIDIRVPVSPTPPETLLGPPGESSSAIRARVELAIRMQASRNKGGAAGSLSRPHARNSRLSPAQVEAFCPLDSTALSVFRRAVERLDLSSRACHSVMKIARTIADLAGSETIGENHLLEAVQHRRLCDDEIWPND